MKPTRSPLAFTPLILVGLATGTPVFAQEKSETKPPAPAPAAVPMLESADAASLAVFETARRAYNENKFDQSAERFREFLKQNAKKKEGAAAQYGLALSLLEHPQRDIPAITAALMAIVDTPAASERPFAFYHLGRLARTRGLQTLDSAAGKPAPEIAQARTQAAPHFTEAAKLFVASADACAEALKSKPDADTEAALRDARLRARSEQLDILLRQNENKEAASVAQTLLQDSDLAKSPVRATVLYQQGCAEFGLNNLLAAGRALSRVAPFDQPFGVHARYLLSRIHHLGGEFPEALAGYKALIADFEQQRKMAGEALKNPAIWSAEERARFESLQKAPPEFVAQATFYYALIQTEAGEVGDALAVLNAFIQQFPNSPLIDEAKLRQGYCYLQLKNFPEAHKTLQPLQSNPRIADRALWWSARAHFGAGDPANAQAYEKITKSALELFQSAAEKAAELGATDAEARLRRGEILLDLGDTQIIVRKFKDGAATYEKVQAEYPGTVLAEEALERQSAALHLDTQYKASMALCQKFEQTYPKSTLLEAVWYRGAENAFLGAMSASMDPTASANRAEWEKQFDDAIDRYQRLLTRYPEFAQINMARYGLGTAQFRRGLYADAFKTLGAILDADRNGELAQVNYLLAESLLRRMPEDANDALQAAQILDRAELAARLLEKYAGAQGKTPQGADALLKLGHCYQRMGSLMIVAQERQKYLGQARQAYEKIMNEMGNTPAMSAAVLERAQVIALQGDINGAMNECNRFNHDPLKQSALAPLALIRFSTLLQTQNRHNDAVNTMAECRKRYEDMLRKDAVRVEWVPQVQYEHALALRSAGKIAEARAIFEGIAKEFDKAPEGAHAAWRAAQCRREELQGVLAAAFTQRKKPGVKPEELAAATKQIDESLTGLRQISESLKSDAARQGGNSASDAKVRMLYEAAWCYRALADAEIENARAAAAAKVLENVHENWKKVNPNQPPPSLAVPEIQLQDIPAQPNEKAAQDQYRAILSLAPASPLAPRIRLELAELLARRNDNDAALELLATALEDTPAQELSERLHLRIASVLLAKDEPIYALQQAQLVLKNQASPVSGEAVYVAGEAFAQQKDYNNAINHFVSFRDKDPFRNMNVLTERGLARLAHAFAQAQRHDESRQAQEQIVQRFPNSPLAVEARLGIAAFWEKANQHDNAYNNYAEIARRFAGEQAARAQFQMGRLRMAQKRFAEAQKDFQTVVTLYSGAEIAAEALVEMGQAHWEQKQAAEASAAWQRVEKEYGGSTWAAAAKKRLAETAGTK